MAVVYFSHMYLGSRYIPLEVEAGFDEALVSPRGHGICGGASFLLVRIGVWMVKGGGTAIIIFGRNIEMIIYEKHKTAS